MANVLLVAYLLIVLALIVVILIQRSEGGALGIGGSNSGGGLVSARGSANLLTRTTAILATLFFVSAIGLTILAELDRGTSSILDNAVTNSDGSQPSTVLDALNALQGDLPVPAAPAQSATDLPVPVAPAEAPAAPATGN
ncbi:MULTISPECIES: preprotein translocase subunit SecG [unclassified Devosia]|jgi:preprotein translocase subunit SecG|uniref:preprotein translocase subunit SecG n=1 Tax=unclassified Devosia TaxID=196773 RepID=UPI00145C64F6|nr:MULTISPECIES: preprotein translocase subunit SecG [unclassified Devosia]MBJ6986304.1 preprotein translocase subunit SecG [Devosia sp. MC521]MBJ7576416.1 preprotein translocase subunit SecG [Devosia sp. MC532]QMW64216.1 preprotein translocase subunit SecG [Devosia sp. MC521]